MIAEHQRSSNKSVGIAFALWVFGFLIMFASGGNKSMDAVGVLGLVTFISGSGFWFYGCCKYAAAKGYSIVVGLVSLLGLIGLLILLGLPDKCKEDSEIDKAA